MVNEKTRKNTMKSLKELYKIGRGPSSSHTIGPERIAEYVLKEHGAGNYEAELFGSLAMTGKGHGTDRVLKEVLGENTVIVFNTEETDLPHPNTLKIYKTENGTKKLLATAQSIGGGDVIVNGKDLSETKNVYPEKNFEEIKAYLAKTGKNLLQYVEEHEKDAIPFLKTIWKAMKDSVKRGLKKQGVLSGGLNLSRKARALYTDEAKFETSIMRENRKLSAYALAVAEENADNGEIVTAPTCGSCGVVPSVLYYMFKECNTPEKEIINSLAVAGVIGNVVKANASISGAECGCQAEVGVACSMAAAALAFIYGLNTDEIEYSAEIALEHNLGLTCDPVCGLVQIPCIERNAMASVKAVNAVTLAKSLENKHKISFDGIVSVMYETGKNMNGMYKETSEGGLAKLYSANLSNDLK